MKSTLSRHLAAGTILSSLLMMGTPHAQTTGSDDLLKMEKNAANASLIRVHTVIVRSGC